MKRKKLFLDLEKTIIDDFISFNILPTKINKIKEFIKNNNIDEVFIFSMAIAHQKDWDRFCIKLNTTPLDTMLSIKSFQPIFIEQAFDNLVKRVNIQAEFWEFSDIFPFNGKRQFFQELINFEIIKSDQPTNFILFDDTVEDMFIQPNNGHQITFINI